MGELVLTIVVKFDSVADQEKIAAFEVDLDASADALALKHGVEIADFFGKKKDD